MAAIVLAHGAWSAAWAWKKMRPLIGAAGHEFFSPTYGNGWKLPINPMPPDTAPADVAWASPRRRPQPIKTLEQKLRLESKAAPPPRHYIYAKRNGPGDVFRQFGERARSEAGWTYHEMDCSHNPHIICPEALMAQLSDIMTGK